MRVIGIDVGLKRLGICILENRTVVLLQEFDICMDQITQCVACQQQARFHYKHMLYGCKDHTVQGMVEIRSLPVKRLSLKQRIDKILLFLRFVHSTHQNIDYISIELQPPRNRVMVNTSVALYTHAQHLWPEAQVGFQHALIKLKDAPADIVQCDIKDPYRRRKQQSRQMTEFLLQRQIKSADVCDAFLIAFTHLATLYQAQRSESGDRE